ncbi:MAG: hypothetical protein KDI74_04755 [Gammaproteobacteria bacterium]|nr:hypothetical protein [Gammaproteobacteria bacterium]
MKRGRGQAKATLDFIEACTEILKVEQPTSVRAVAYRLFTQGVIPNMGRNSTNKVSRILTTAREDGIIPWEWIVDETREAERVNTWSNSDQIIRATVNGYRRDYWQSQPEWVEVWSEKGTVRGILAPVLDKYGITFRVMHGYASATVMQDIASETRQADKRLTVLYVGDYDPSGMHMSEVDLPQRIRRYGGSARIRRTALTAEDLPNLPYFEAATKKADKRYQWFVSSYGHKAWELDAMQSSLLRDRVESEIASLLDLDAWEHATQIESAEVESMQRFYQAWRSAQC